VGTKVQLSVLGAAEGLVKTDTPEDADVILFNTCSVRKKKRRKKSSADRYS
jgi:tRNA A37 methylthiotransferase MiaB